MTAEINALNTVSSQAPLLYSADPMDSPLLPRKYQRLSPDAEDDKLIQPFITGSFRSTTTFKVDRLANVTLYPQLELTLSAIAPPTGAVASWTQYIGFEIIDNVIIRHGAENCQVFPGHILRLRHDALLRSDKNYAETVLVNEGRTNSQLYNDALTTLNLSTPLRACFWEYDITKGWLCKHFQDPLTVEVTYKSLPNVVNLWANQGSVGAWSTGGALTPNAGTASATIVKQALRITYVSTTEAVEAVRSAMINSPPSGVIYPFHDIETAKTIILVGNGAVESPVMVDIKPLKSPCVYLFLEIRNQSDLVTSWGMRYDNWVALSTFEIESNQTKLVCKQTHENLIDVHWPRHLNGSNTVFTGAPFYVWSFSRDPADSHNQWGAQYLGSLSTPTINIELNSAASVPLQVDVTSNCFNTIQMYKQGAKKNFW